MKIKMINIKELKGTLFKKELNLNRCRFGYHNKNNSGGNFGLDFYKEEEFNEKTDFNLWGNYDNDGNMKSLGIMSIRIGQFQYKIDLGDCDDINKLIQYLKDFYRNLILEVLK